MWNTDVLEVSRRWESDIGNSPLILITYCNEKDISKKLDLKLSASPLPRTSKCGSSIVLTQMISLANERSPRSEIPKKRKATPRPSKDEVVTSQAKDMSPLRKKPTLPSAVINSSLKEVLSAEKTQVKTASSSSAKVKHLIDEDNKKIDVAPLLDKHASSAKLQEVKRGTSLTLLIPFEARMKEAKETRESSACANWWSKEELEKKTAELNSMLSA
ncbi:hypothetical protein L3X38_036895 [Prunus dulcis]|uniref:Uncharacterized protein n=1 Tax=Prunus dulcis TaxID=3755 RepID=A0AAD4V3H2_PRUDU|nr:hypothetical protein L3X38_036895 [Prunus dulcis]